MICSVTKLQEKPVIDKCSGSKLGFVYDVEIDTETASLCAMFVVGKEKTASFLPKNVKYRVNWDEIELIGKDAIIVTKYNVFTDSASENSLLSKLWG